MKYTYFITVLKCVFKVSILYQTIFILGNFYATTFEKQQQNHILFFIVLKQYIFNVCTESFLLTSSG